VFVKRAGAASTTSCMFGAAGAEVWWRRGKVTRGRRCPGDDVAEHRPGSGSRFRRRAVARPGPPRDADRHGGRLLRPATTTPVPRDRHGLGFRAEGSPKKKSAEIHTPRGSVSARRGDDVGAGRGRAPLGRVTIRVRRRLSGPWYVTVSPPSGSARTRVGADPTTAARAREAGSGDLRACKDVRCSSRRR